MTRARLEEPRKEKEKRANWASGHGDGRERYITARPGMAQGA